MVNQIPEEDVLVLDINRQGDLLKMSIYEQKESASTLRNYSQHKVNFIEIYRYVDEITQILNRAVIQDVDSIKSLQKTAQALWEHILAKPVKEKLKTSKSLSLVLTIDEELINIPWEILFDGESFLCLKYSLGRLVKTKSQSVPIQYRSHSHIFKMLILANPTNDLQSAYAEGLSIKNQFSHRLKNFIIDFKSINIDKIYVKKNFCDYDIVHFAGHCEYEQISPKSSGWVLSDGRFTIADILSMGSSASLPSLVFSNACHSAQEIKGLIDPEYQKKNYSIGAAFLFSGVRHYIGSIRKIEDKASLSFAKEFYHQLIGQKSVGESLRLARLKLIREYGITSMHWLNYLLYGDPNFVLFKPKSKGAKTKPKLNLFKIWFPKVLFWVSVLSLCALIFTGIASINPSLRILLFKAQKLFISGRNQAALAIAKDIVKKSPKFMDTYPLLADISWRIGDKDGALKYYFDYAFLCEEKRDFKHLTLAYINIGWYYQLEGEFDKSIEFYNKAADLAQKNRDKLSEAIVLRKLAVWNIDKNNYDLALEFLTKSSEINRERKHIYEHRYNLACDYFDIGLVFSNKNDYKAAEEFYRKSRDIFERLQLKQELSDYYFNLGELYFYEKQYQKALGLYLKGLRIDESSGNKVNLSSDYNMIGDLYMEMGNLLEAERFYIQAVKYAEELKSRPDLAQANYSLGLLYKKAGKINKAKEFLRKAQEIYGVIDPVAYKEVKDEILSLN